MRPLVVLVLCLLCACGSRPVPPVATPPIVILDVAGLRADAVGALGGPQGLTPHLDDFFSSASWSGTAIASSDRPEAAVGSIFTGLGPWQHGLWFAGESTLFSGPPTLASTLSAAGYRTTGFFGRPELGPRSGLGRGFDDYRAMHRLRLASKALAGLGGGRELLWIQLDSLLPPFELVPRLLPRLVRPPEKLPRQIDPGRLAAGARPEARRQLRALYEISVARTDELFGRLIADLGASGQAERAIVVVYSDVGTALGDRSPLPARRALRRKVLEVPLAIRLPPGLPRIAPTRGEPVALCRLFSTLLEAAGQTVPPAAAPSLFVPGETGILSESYRAGGDNLFSFLRGGLQLQWTSRYRPIIPVQPEEAAAGFFDTPPLWGIAPGPQRWLEQWTPAGGTRPLDDAPRQRELEASLEQTWLLFQEGQVTPRQQRDLAGG